MIADENGVIIPLNIESGQIAWSAKGEDGNKTLTGYSEQVSISDGTASTYNCANCCPDSFYSSWLTPNSVSGYVGDTSQFTFYAQTTNCYGQVQAAYAVYNGVYWNSENTSVASCNQNGFATGVGVGTTRISGSYTPDIYISTYQSPTVYSCNWEPGFAYSDADCDIVPPPTVNIDTFKAVGKNHLISVAVDVNSNPNYLPIILTLVPNQGSTGTAHFQDTGTNTKTIISTENVAIKGITESSTNNNMRIKATLQSNNSLLDTKDFTVISVALSLRTNKQVSTDNSRRFNFYNLSIPKTYDLKVVLVNDQTPLRWGHGVEIVGTVLPNNFDEDIILERSVDNYKIFKGTTQIDSGGPFTDLSPADFRDDDPQSGNSVGKVYDLDIPRINISGLLLNEIKRFRVNFSQYATVDGIVVSDSLNWYTAISVVNNGTSNGTTVNSSGVTGDNSAGTGTIPLTWNIN